MVTDTLIKEKLNKKEARELLRLCRNYYPIPIHILKNHENFIKQKEGKTMTGGIFTKRVKECRKIHDLYLKITTDEKEYLSHWEISRTIQNEEGVKYRHNNKPIRQDNKTAINYGNRRGYTRDIRFPSKKRKTAWKRFYRLFPSLKPKEEDLNEILTKDNK